MSVPLRAVLTAAAAALVAGAVRLGEPALVGVCVALVLVVAIGWPALVAAPSRRGTGVVVGLGGLGGLAAVTLTDGDPYLRELPAVLAVAVLAAFVHELVRRDGRERLVESVAGTVAGVVLAATAGGWVAIGRTDEGATVILVGAVALAVGSVASAVRLGARLSGWLAPITVATATAGGAVTGQLTSDPLPGALLGLAVGIVVATTHRVLDRLPSLRGRWAALTAAVLPVVASGVLVYVVGRILVG